MMLSVMTLPPAVVRDVGRSRETLLPSAARSMVAAPRKSRAPMVRVPMPPEPGVRILAEESATDSALMVPVPLTEPWVRVTTGARATVPWWSRAASAPLMVRAPEPARAPAPLKARVPPVTLVGPAKVLVPVRVSVPVPDLVRPLEPVPLMTPPKDPAPATVRPPSLPREMTPPFAPPPEMVFTDWAKPPSERVAPATSARMTSELAERTLAAPAARVPAETVVAPEWVLAPVRVSVPVPALVRPSVPAPAPSWKTPAKVPLRSEALPTVSAALVADPFSTTGAPGVAFEVRLAATTLKPFRRSVPALAAPKATVFSEPAVALSAPAWPSASTPPSIATPPRKVLAPERVSVPAPDLSKPPRPVPALSMGSAIVSAKPLVSILAPPSLTLVVMPAKPGRSAPAMNWPPLKFSSLVSPEVTVIRDSVSVPPSRLTMALVLAPVVPAW